MEPQGALMPTRSRFEDIEARAIKSALTAHEYVLRGGRAHLFLLVAGSGRLSSDDGENRLVAPCLVWLPEGRQRRLRLEAGTRGRVLSVPDPILGSAIPSESIGAPIREAISLPTIRRDLDDAFIQRTEDLIEGIESELYEGAPAARTAVRYSLSLLLIALWRSLRPDTGAPRPQPRNVVHHFMFLVDLHLHEHWTLQQYANQIGVSKDRLGSAVRRATGRAPLAHVHHRLMTEATALLTGTDLQVAEVGYRLGFGDAAYFNRFFQRHAGIPPGRFRREASLQASEPEPSFAAWP